MKKFLKVLIVMVLVVCPFVNVNAKTTTKAKDPVNFYIFYGSGCSHCAELHEYTAELENNKKINKKFKIVDLEVWSNQENSELMTIVGQYFNYDVDGVPFYVIGDEYFSGFSEESSPEKIEAAIDKAYNNSEYVDIVAGIQDGSIEVEVPTESETDKKNDTVGYIILGITIAVVVAILFGRSSTPSYEEETEEQPEEKVEEKKIEEKITTTNKTKTTQKKTTKAKK